MNLIYQHFSSDKTKAFALRLHRIILLAITVSLMSDRVTAQIIPDNTLPSNSVVTSNGNSLTINGGTTAGSNLFHSFREFSLPTGSEGFFNNAANIQNIFSRVTGGKISNIDGLIRANGSANLFLINPNGIIFGSNARLDIGGSFLASTANSIVFDEGAIFTANNPQVTPLLTVNVPIGLQFQQNSGAIQVEGLGHSFTTKTSTLTPINRGESMTSLSVKKGQTLALIGGDINLYGGVLEAEGGRIELGSASVGQVSLRPSSPGWNLDYEQVQSFRDIKLSQQAAVDVSGVGSGSIQIVGRRVTLADGSLALIQTQGERSEGILSVNAAESIELLGTNSNATIRTGLVSETLGEGNGANVAVSTERLIVSNGAQLYARTFGLGRGGNLSVNASTEVIATGFSPVNPAVFSTIAAYTNGSGDAGNLSLSTKRLSILEGASVATPAFIGSGGNAIINATESVEVIGFIPNLLQPSSLGSAAINTGKSGSIEINTRRLIVQDGGIVTTVTLAEGAAGSITINAYDSVEVSGKASGAGLPSRIESSGNIEVEFLRQLLGLPDRPSGNSGNVIINTPRLTISDGARVSVANEGTGIAGNLRINAGSIVLSNSNGGISAATASGKGGISAATASGEGGNIDITANSLQLRNGSQISAEAAGTGNGGNLTANINTLAILEGSKVTANAVQGNGGNIRIATQGLFASSDSRITASSQLGVSGTVSINNPNLEPSSGLIQLPQNVVDTTTQIAQGCTSDEGNTFTIAGRGGLPEDPTATIQGLTLWQDLQNYAVESPQSRREPSKVPAVTTIPETPSLVEAVGWQINANGVVELVANLPNGAELSSSDRASNTNCPRQKVDR